MKIFLLDDDYTLIEDVQRLAGKVRTILGQDTDIQLVSCTTLQEARSILFGNDKAVGEFNDIALFLIDYYLDRGESGINLIQDIRNLNKKVPVVLFTSYDSSKNAFEAGEIGASVFSLKEDLISPDNFQGLIEQVLSKTSTLV